MVAGLTFQDVLDFPDRVAGYLSKTLDSLTGILYRAGYFFEDVLDEGRDITRLDKGRFVLGEILQQRHQVGCEILGEMVAFLPSEFVGPLECRFEFTVQLPQQTFPLSGTLRADHNPDFVSQVGTYQVGSDLLELPYRTQVYQSADSFLDIAVLFLALLESCYSRLSVGHDLLQTCLLYRTRFIVDTVLDSQHPSRPSRDLVQDVGRVGVLECERRVTDQVGTLSGRRHGFLLHLFNLLDFLVGFLLLFIPLLGSFLSSFGQFFGFLTEREQTTEEVNNAFPDFTHGFTDSSQDTFHSYLVVGTRGLRCVAIDVRQPHTKRLQTHSLGLRNTALRFQFTQYRLELYSRLQRHGFLNDSFVVRLLGFRDETYFQGVGGEEWRLQPLLQIILHNAHVHFL